MGTNILNEITISLAFSGANPAADAAANLTLAQGCTGFIVPTGYKFHPLMISGMSNADLTAGTATFKVTDNGTAIANGPEPALGDTAQNAAAEAAIGKCPIAAGHLVGVSVTTNAAYLPVTADMDALLVGVLVQG